MSSPNGAPTCLDGGGEMGALMRALDWSKTPLGPVDTWPQSLRTTVSTCLNSRFPILVWWGPELAMLYNDAYRQVLGDKHPRSLGLAGRACWPEIWDIIGPMLEGVLERGEATWSEDTMLPLARLGFVEECYFTFSYSPIRDESGGVGGVFTAVTETTERVLAERRLGALRELAIAALEPASDAEASEAAIRVLSKNSADCPFGAIYLRDGDPSALRRVATHGLDPESKAAPREVTLSDARWPFEDALRTGEPVVVNDVRARFGDLPGGPWPESAHTAVVLPIARGGDTQAYGALVVGVSPRRPLDDRYRDFLSLAAAQVATAIANARAQQEQRRRAEALAELDRAKTAFFSNVSHEFRTPLTLMLAPLEDLLASERFGDAERGQLEILQRNAQRISKLVNALLDFARIEGGATRAVHEPTDLAQLTSDVAAVFRSAIERAGLRFDVRCKGPFDVLVDRAMWETIVSNLLSNALKYTFQGAITVTLDREGKQAVLSVRDTGVGIAEEELGRVFDRFHRVQGSRGRTHEGTGIGLALVQELVRLHGGTVSVESRVGEGSVFTVRVPIEQLGTEEPKPQRTLHAGARVFADEASRWVGEAEGPRASAEDAIAMRQPVVDDASILVADDNADMREYLVRLLSSRWRVRTASDGASALAAIAAEMPDLVLTDVMMPSIDGFGLLQRLRANPATRKLPVVMLSARAGEESRVEGLSAGADDYIVKPFGARELVARINSLIALARVRRAHERQYEQLFRLFQQAPEPFCVISGADLVYENANPAYCRLVGRDVRGRPLLEVLPELRGQGFDELLRQVMKTGEAAVGRETLVRYDPTGGGGGPQDTYWTFTYAPLRDDDGVVRRVVCYCHHVTDHVRARAELEAARAAAEQANRAKDEFLALLGHELRNPLAPIVTGLQLMRAREPDFMPKERAILERQVRHLTRLVDDLLDVSRIARGKVRLKRRVLDLSDVITRAIETVSPLLEERHHRLACDVASALFVDGDDDRLAQVISNLLTNAAKYTPAGGNISLSALGIGDEILVSVRDDGMGMPRELLPHVFDLFVQGARPEQLQAGLGLGLTLVKSLVELHGGSVSAASDGAGKGSEFVVRLPAAVHAHAATAESVRPTSTRAKSGRRVLLVDDNSDAAELLADSLRLAGHDVEVANDGPGALEIAARAQPEVAVLDIGLPVMDGYELARRLRDVPGLANVQLVALTGYGQASDRRRALDAGFAVHLVKPVDLDVLEDAVETVGRP